MKHRTLDPNPIAFLGRGITRSGVRYSVIRMRDGRELICRAFDQPRRETRPAPPVTRAANRRIRTLRQP